jgi:hypothetical protein
MHFEPVPQNDIGTPTAMSEHFKTNFPQYEQYFLELAAAHGFTQDLWPSGAMFIQPMVHRSLLSGMLPEAIPTNKPMQRTAYSGPKQHELVAQDFNRAFSMLTNAVFVITKGEDWWPHEKSFLADDTDSYMLYCLYQRARTHKEVLVGRPKRGRPRNEAAHAARAEKSSRYQEWLAECEAYRVRYNELKAAYLNALAEYSQWKEQGAPKWIP